jgi:hypothetical protein
MRVSCILHFIKYYEDEFKDTENVGACIQNVSLRT